MQASEPLLGQMLKAVITLPTTVKAAAAGHLNIKHQIHRRRRQRNAHIRTRAPHHLLESSCSMALSLWSRSSSVSNSGATRSGLVTPHSRCPPPHAMGQPTFRSQPTADMHIPVETCMCCVVIPAKVIKASLTAAMCAPWQ